MKALTPAQRKALDQICRSNGAGVSISVGTCHALYGLPLSYPWRKLWDLDLIQGKANHAGYVVHTRKGLALWRELEGITNG
jgi:hypothetical protein